MRKRAEIEKFIRDFDFVKYLNEFKLMEKHNLELLRTAVADDKVFIAIVKAFLDAPEMARRIYLPSRKDFRRIICYAIGLEEEKGQRVNWRQVANVLKIYAGDEAKRFYTQAKKELNKRAKKI